jgi:hypothetical protein
MHFTAIEVVTLEQWLKTTIPGIRASQSCAISCPVFFPSLDLITSPAELGRNLG